MWIINILVFLLALLGLLFGSIGAMELIIGTGIMIAWNINNKKRG